MKIPISKVSISRAAEMAGVTRATMYRHIEKKGITVEKDSDDNPKIDVSELIRVYGNKLKLIEEGDELNSHDTPETIHPIQDDTPKIKQSIQDNTPQYAVSESEILKEKIRNLEAMKEALENERVREREQLNEQIDVLRHNLEKAQSHHHQLTALLTDQRSEEEKRGSMVNQQSQQIQDMMEAMHNLMSERQEEQRRMEALENRLAKMKESGEGIIQKLNERNKKLIRKNRELEEEMKKPWYKKLVG